MHKILYSILLNYFILFQLVLQKEPSVLIVIIFHRIHKKVVHFNKTYSIRKRQRVFTFTGRLQILNFTLIGTWILTKVMGPGNQIYA